MIAPSGIIIVHTLFHGVCHHLFHSRLIHSGIIPINHRQTHGSHSQSGQLQVLIILINHIFLLLSFPSPPMDFHSPVSSTARSTVLLRIIISLKVYLKSILLYQIGQLLCLVPAQPSAYAPPSGANPIRTFLYPTILPSSFPLRNRMSPSVSQDKCPSSSR